MRQTIYRAYFCPKEDLLPNTPSSVLPAERIASKRILEEVGRTIPMPAVMRFIACEEFSTHKSSRGLKLTPSSARFMALIWNVVEESVGSVTLIGYKCQEHCGNDPILEELGGVDRAKIALAHMNMFLKWSADRSEWYCFFVPIQDEIVEVDAHYVPSLGAWDLNLSGISDSVVVKNTHVIIAPVI